MKIFHFDKSRSFCRSSYLFLFFSAFLFTSVVCTAQNQEKKEYKIGVNLFGSTISQLTTEIIAIKQQIAANIPQRESSERRVELVVQVDVSWANTEPVENNYNFQFYIQLAEVCENLGVKLSPIMSTHYYPCFIKAKYVSNGSSFKCRYQPDGIGTGTIDARLTDITSNDDLVENSVGLPFFLELSPSSGFWDDAGNWISAFIDAMSSSGHLGSTKAIEEIFVGNELYYPSWEVSPNNWSLVTGDPVTRNAWAAQMGTSFPTQMDPQSIFREFRANQLNFALGKLFNAAKNALINNNVNDDIALTTKTYSYFFRDGQIDKWWKESGYTENSLPVLDNMSVNAFAIDAYPFLDDQGYWKDLAVHLASTRRFTDKPIYLAEFNSDNGNDVKLGEDEIFELLKDAIEVYDVRYISFFAWNPGTAPDVQKWKITTQQIAGLKKLFDYLACPPIQVNTNTQPVVQVTNPYSRTSCPVGSNYQSGYAGKYVKYRLDDNNNSVADINFTLNTKSGTTIIDTKFALLFYPKANNNASLKYDINSPTIANFNTGALINLVNKDISDGKLVVYNSAVGNQVFGSPYLSKDCIKGFTVEVPEQTDIKLGIKIEAMVNGIKKEFYKTLELVKSYSAPSNSSLCGFTEQASFPYSAYLTSSFTTSTLTGSISTGVITGSYTYDMVATLDASAVNSYDLDVIPIAYPATCAVGNTTITIAQTSSDCFQNGLRKGFAQEQNTADFDSLPSPKKVPFPNPISSGELYFGREVSSYSLINSNGIQVRKGNNADKIEISGLGAGLYLLRLDDQAEKIIIQ